MKKRLCFPQTQMGIPIWCHLQGFKMNVKQLDVQNRILIIGSSAATVTIRRASTVVSGAEGWFVDWEVVQCRPYEEGAKGRSQFSDEDLASAFDLSENSGSSGDWLIERFGADVANQGKYIRWKQYLNIPCPGTGNDGDPNVSICLNPNMQESVRRLLQ